MNIPVGQQQQQQRVKSSHRRTLSIADGQFELISSSDIFSDTVLGEFNTMRSIIMHHLFNGVSRQSIAISCSALRHLEEK